MRILLVLPLFTTLGGCAGSLVGDAIAGPEKIAQQDDAYCASIGAPAGSPNYSNCRMQLTTNRDQRHTVARTGVAQGLIAAGQAATPPPSNSITCVRNGNMTTCN